MDLWNRLKTTDPKYTKEVKFGRKFTAIDPQWQVKRMTEEFGPCGEGWGYTFERAEYPDLPDFPVIVTATLWCSFDYPDSEGHPGGKRTVTRSAATTLYKNGKFEPDNIKKVETEALSKCYPM